VPRGHEGPASANPASVFPMLTAGAPGPQATASRPNHANLNKVCMSFPVMRPAPLPLFLTLSWAKPDRGVSQKDGDILQIVLP
jgi:hypothetical protein